MPRARSTAPEEEEDTQTRILDAAEQCFSQLGIAKTSLNDVARVANLSRGTVYRYFADRQALIDAVVEAGTQRNFDRAAAVMVTKPTLAKQVGAYAEIAVRSAIEHHSYNRLLEGDVGLMQVILADPEASFRRSIDFLVPYVRAAKVRGEIGKSVPVVDAAEWLARVLLTLVSTPTSVSFDVQDPRSVARFMERFAVTGLLGKP